MKRERKGKRPQFRRLPREKETFFRRVLEETRRGSRFDESENFIQHGQTTVKEHSIHVAQTAYYIACKFHLDVDEYSLIRGALLHDYFLYDWHEKCWANSIHGFTHPGKALDNAEKDFILKDVERDMISHHMFPLTVLPPRTREGMILCIADKLCAAGETIGDRVR